MNIAKLVALLAGLAACHRGVSARAGPDVSVPRAYTAGAPGRPAPERWWKEFGDAALDRVVDQVLARNLELRAARARVIEARALARQAGAARWPELTLEGGALRQKQAFELGPQGTQVFETTVYTLSGSASYEVDVWGRIDALATAGVLEADAAADDARALAMTLVAEVVETWFDLGYGAALVELLETQVRANEIYVELTRLRFEQGLAPATDTFQQAARLATTRAELLRARADLAVARLRLAVLAGATPSELAIEPPAGLRDPAPAPATGIPADLLERRPDLRAARRRLEAADQRVAAAIADRLPSLRIGATYGFRGTTLGALLDTTIWSLFAGLVAPLFDGGRRAAVVAERRAQVERRLAEYGLAFLRAVSEVEGALARERREARAAASLERALEAARAALDGALDRYLLGVDDFLRVLTALEAEQQADKALLAARRRRLTHRVELHRALSGGLAANGAPR